DALVRMAQEFSMRLVLVDGQGNFGSVDGDPPAAMRYTESRLAKSAECLLRDIDRDTVDFIPNYDETQNEPVVLPAEYPNLLVNGASGIAVGMATNIPPHNAGEVLDACMAYMCDPDISNEALLDIVPGPDFPTGGIIKGREGIRSAFATGRGSITIQAKAEIATNKNRQQIIIDELPYQVNKAQLLERIGELVRDKVIDGITDIRDLSDRKGMRVVIDIRRDTQADLVLNQLYRHTRMQSVFSVNLLVLDQGLPKQMGIRAVIAAFCQFRRQVITRRTQYQLAEARTRAHILLGYMVALSNIDEAIALIRRAADADTARQDLTARVWDGEAIEGFVALIDTPQTSVPKDAGGGYRLSDAQARAILELRLQRLTALEQNKLIEEAQDIKARISEYLEILSNEDRLTATMLAEMEAIRETIASPRLTEISDAVATQSIETLIANKSMVITLSERGYIKRVPLPIYRLQKRGGRGRAGMKTRADDSVRHVLVANTHDWLLFFTSKGIVYRLKCHRLPETNPQTQGKAIVNFLPNLDKGETIQAIMPLSAKREAWETMHVIFATAKGGVRRNRLSDFSLIHRGGKKAMQLPKGDRLVAVVACHDTKPNTGDATAEVFLASKNGKAIRFALDDLRVHQGRDSTGVRGMQLKGDDEVISMAVLEGDKQDILSVTENGYGKRSAVSAYRRTNRGGQGVANITTSKRNGKVVASFPVAAGDQLMLATNTGMVLRIHGAGQGEIGVMGRQSQGVRLFSIQAEHGTAEVNEKIVSVGRIAKSVIGDAPKTNEDA
ncbi:MAG: DNA gyrase subunit A, partial [Proteobacteria bacterium]|nr:DNA gyrase subunit A [Pseudomonadota bacterium]